VQENFYNLINSSKINIFTIGVGWPIRAFTTDRFTSDPSGTQEVQSTWDSNFLPESVNYELSFGWCEMWHPSGVVSDDDDDGPPGCCKKELDLWIIGGRGFPRVKSQNMKLKYGETELEWEDAFWLKKGRCCFEWFKCKVRKMKRSPDKLSLSSGDASVVLTKTPREHRLHILIFSIPYFVQVLISPLIGIGIPFINSIKSSTQLTRTT